MNLLEMIVGAVIAWVIPKMLDSILERRKREGQEEKRLEGSFPWVKWCLALSIGGGIGGFLSAALGVLGLQTPGGLGNWTVFGVAIGVSQWAVLRRYLAVGPFWAVFSALGWSVWAFFQAAQMSPYLGWGAVGLTVGILQWFMLVRIRQKAAWWIPANVVGWLVAGSLGYVMGLSLLQAGLSLPVAWVIGWACVGAIGSISLGFSLARMPPKQNATV